MGAIFSIVLVLGVGRGGRDGPFASEVVGTFVGAGAGTGAGGCAGCAVTVGLAGVAAMALSFGIVGTYASRFTVKGVGAVGSGSGTLDLRPVGARTYVGDCAVSGVDGVPGMMLSRRRWIGDAGDTGVLAPTFAWSGAAAADSGEPALTGSIFSFSVLGDYTLLGSRVSRGCRAAPC